MKITPEVFVSSTWEDLNDCRSAILANFPRLDILYRGMELFGARTPLPKDAMLAEVRACDLFIGIVGHRYGSEDPGDLCSYTELEYREAMTCKIPVLIFLVDNKSVQIPPEHVEPDRKRRKLARWKEELEGNHTCDKFTDPTKLAIGVARAIQRWLDDTRSWHEELLFASNPLQEGDRRLLRTLYASDEAAAVQACGKLAGGAAAVRGLEHLYALLRTRSSSETIRSAVFRALRAVPGYRRVSEILEEMIEDPDPLLRLGAATAVGECARSPLGWISQRVAKRTLTAASDPDWHVRDEVAHALPKIARKYRNMVNDCVETLKRLQEADSAPQVKERARTSLKDMDSLTFLE